MIIKLEPEEINVWFLAFFTRCGSEFFNRWVPGKYKHVSAFAFSPSTKTWVWYDVSLKGTKIMLLPPGWQSDEILAFMTREADILRVERGKVPSVGMRLGFWCVPAVKHLIWSNCSALIPSTLWRYCLKDGAKIIFQQD